MSFICWATNGPYLAIGTENGNLIILNKTLNRKSQVRGVFTKKITCGHWNERNQLALGSDDGRIVVLTAEGKSFKSFTHSVSQVSLEWGDLMKTDQTLSNPKEQSLLSVDSKCGIRIYNELATECVIELNQTFGKLGTARFAIII